MTGVHENRSRPTFTGPPPVAPLVLRDEDASLGRRKIDHQMGRGAAMSSSFEQGAAVAALRVPHGVFCLSSAAALHGLLPRTYERFSFAVSGPVPFDEFTGSVRLLRWTFPGALKRGVEEGWIGTTRIRSTSPARTVVDLLRYARRPGGEGTALIAGRAFLVEGGCLRDLEEIAAATGAPASVGRMLEFLKLYQGEGVR